MSRERVRGVEVFTCPEPAFHGCRLTRRACALRHLLRHLVGKQKTATSPAHLKTCSACPVGARHARELGLEAPEPVRLPPVAVAGRGRRLARSRD